jgi:hypothetical protein
MQWEFHVRPGPGSTGALVNKAVMLQERLTTQALLQLAQDAVAVGYTKPRRSSGLLRVRRTGVSRRRRHRA